MTHNIPSWHVLVSLCAFFLLYGCASTEITHDNPDPLEGYNRFMFTVNDNLDKAILKPVAKGYQTVMPDILNDGITNFFSNLGDVVVVCNDVLQAKLEQAAMDTSRIVFNTTFGVVGFFDVASHMDLPKHEEDFGQTLGYWGIGEGYYLVLPLFGPSTTRDTVGLVVDSFADPVGQVNPARDRYIMRAVNVVDTRADLLRVERTLEQAQIDPYAFQREAYLQRRRNLVYDGNPPPPKLDFEDNKP